MSESIQTKLKKQSCPKCSGDVLVTLAEDGKGWELAQCTNKDCRVVTHTGCKLCQMNVCEWHELCGTCDNEICGDYRNLDDKPICDDCLTKVTSFSESEKDGLKQLYDHFTESVKYMETILAKVNSDDISDVKEEIGYIFRDSDNGYWNATMESEFKMMGKIYDRLSYL